MKKRVLCLAIAFALLALTGCQMMAAPGELDVLPIETASVAIISTPAPTPAAAVTTPSEQSVSLVTMGDGEIEGLTELPADYVSTRSLFPEGATEETAEYALTVTLPTFPAAPQDKAELYLTLQSAAEVMKDEALSRVSEERLPLSDRADGAPVPETVLTVKAYSAKDNYELVSLETWTYLGSDKSEKLSATVFSAEGVELSLNDMVGGYDAKDIAAQQVYNVIDRQDGAFYNDISLEDITLALDIYDGFVVSDKGIVILFAPGSVAPEEALTQRVLIKRAALWPDAVNEAISQGVLSEEEYAALLGALRSIACAVAPNYESFTASAPGPYAATAFMTQMLTREVCVSCSPIPFVTVDRAEYERIYKGYFTSPIPNISGDAPMTDGTVLSKDGSIYNVPLTTLSAYSFRPDALSSEGDALILSGAIMSDAQGEGESAMASAQITLIRNDAAARGFYINTVTLN